MRISYDESVDLDGQIDKAIVAARYEELLDGWNGQNAGRFAASFAEDSTVIGFDGSEQSGRASIASEMQQIFEDHKTATYIAKVRSVKLLSADVAILSAVVGMMPPGKSKLLPDRNAHQTVVAVKREREWRIVLFQNTPAQFHGRPELVEQMTAELQQVADGHSARIEADASGLVISDAGGSSAT
jgi:uncharacterized protein (TIGR02246 family)